MRKTNATRTVTVNPRTGTYTVGTVTVNPRLGTATVTPRRRGDYHIHFCRIDCAHSV